MAKTIARATALCLAALFFSGPLAAPLQTISYQAYLTSSTGVPVNGAQVTGTISTATLSGTTLAQLDARYGQAAPARRGVTREAFLRIVTANRDGCWREISN